MSPIVGNRQPSPDPMDLASHLTDDLKNDQWVTSEFDDALTALDTQSITNNIVNQCFAGINKKFPNATPRALLALFLHLSQNSDDIASKNEHLCMNYCKVIFKVVIKQHNNKSLVKKLTNPQELASLVELLLRVAFVNLIKDKLVTYC